MRDKVQRLRGGQPKLDPDVFEEYSKVPERWKRVSVIVGNGFDLSVFARYKKTPTTSYTSFYYYLRSVGVGEENVLVKKMKERKDAKRADWSDFESAIDEITAGSVGQDELLEDLANVQELFSRYLSLVVTPELVNSLDRDSREYKWALRTFSQFAADLSRKQYPEVHFLDNLDHRDIFKFDVFNLNYTSLVDTYLFLDRGQFIPEKYKSSDRNFEFRINPRNFEHHRGCDHKTGCIAYILTDVHHPHGIQSVPRSLLFGTGETSRRDPFGKPYWAQLERKYGRIVDRSNLFIVFGCSLGETDRWWWLKIVERLVDDADVDLLIYKRVRNGRKPEEAEREILDVFSEFVEECLDDRDDGAVQLDAVMEQVFVITYTGAGNISVFGFREDVYDPEDRAKLEN